MKSEQADPKTFYTKTPTVVVLMLVEHPVSLQILQYILIRKKIYPKFRVYDIAKQLKKDPATIRKHLKPLVKFELLSLNGDFGAQFYEFNETKYNAYLRVNPFQKSGGVPSQEAGAGGIPTNGKRPLPKGGRVETKVEIKEKDKKIIDGAGVLGIPSTSARSALNTTQYAEGSSSAGETGFERFFLKNETTPSQPPSSTAGVAPASTQYAEGSSSAGGDINDAPTIQPSAGGNANVTETNGTTGHSGASVNHANGTTTTSGGPRGDLPHRVAERAGWVVNDWKKDTRFTESSIETMTNEFWRQLNQIKNRDWDLAAKFGIHPSQTVKSIHEKVQNQFGVYR